MWTLEGTLFSLMALLIYLTILLILFHFGGKMGVDATIKLGGKERKGTR